MPNRAPFNRFNFIYVINLKRCKARKSHMIKEFRTHGITEYKFFEATDKIDPKVQVMMTNGSVARSYSRFGGQVPFRASQIGNWCSQMNVWKDIVANNRGFCLICEDDIKFTAEGISIISKLLSPPVMKHNKMNMSKPVIIRMGRVLSKKTHNLGIAPRYTKEKYMSNPCYAINKSMAQFLLSHLRQIQCTSDKYTHERIPNRFPRHVQHFSMHPTPVHDLSWIGQMKSEIVGPGRQATPTRQRYVPRRLSRIKHNPIIKR